MGFSSALQSSKGHEQLLSRQDAELRLIDIMKRSMQQKAKCDREYAIGLANVAQQGLKIDRTDELQGSHITKGWRSFMDELEQTSRQLKLNADHLEAVCQDKLTQLYHDKRKARKQYQEEHLKISQQFTHITEDVQRKKLEYQKHLDNYKVLRARFEEQFVKGGRSGRKIDDVADKYKKACRKLHLAHNEYVLLINEAIEIEKDFRTILLPGLLEHQQTLQEGFIQTWKNLLLEIVESGDLTSEKFNTIQRRIETNVNDINPGEEYKEFTEKHKTCPPTPTLFQFDESLIEDKLGKLQANTLTVDNLTVEWLRTRLNELEASLKECQDRQAKYCNENGISAPSTPTMNGGINGHNGTKDLNKNSKDLQTLRCQERQMLKLVEIIKTALNEIGCEELPSGCDDVIEQTFIESTLNHEHPDTPHSSSYLLQKGAEVMSIFRTFRRKSGPPNSPTRTPKHGRSAENLGSSVISLDFREVMCAVDDNNDVEDNANNNLSDDEKDNNSNTEELFEDIDVMDTNQNNSNNNVCFRSTNNIYVDIESTEMSPYAKCVDESLKTTETEVDDEEEYKHNESSNTCVKKAIEEKNDSKNNLLLGNDNGNMCEYKEDKGKEQEVCPETILKGIEKLSFTEKLKNKMRKSSSTDATIAGLGSSQETNNNATGLKDRFNRFKTTKGDNYRCLSETESEASRKSYKKLKGKPRKRLFRQLTEERNLMGCEERFESIEHPDTLKSIVPSTGKKKSKSISSTIMTHIRDIKMKNGSNKVREIDPKDREKTKAMTNEMSHRLSEIKFLFEAEAKDIEFEEIIESEAESLINIKNADQIGYHSLLPYEKAEAQSKSHDFPSMPPNIQITDLDDDETFECPVANQSLSSEPKPKFKFAHSIKSRLKLRLRKHKKLSESAFLDQSSHSHHIPKSCNLCTKPIKYLLHPSPTVADFEKEFHTSEIFSCEKEYCSCARAEESSCCSENSSGDGNFTIKRHITVKTNDSTNSSNSNCSMTISGNRPLYEEEWFHGVLPREEVVRLLCNDGDFLVRETTRNDESQTVLSVCWTGHKHFIVQTTAEGYFRFEGPAFPSIQELILHQYQSELPVTSRSGAVLKKPILRERWELSNDDVILLDKIGRGNFGDVYKAKLKSSPKKEVAVKTCRMTLPDEQKRKFLQEGRILKQYDHPNIVKLIGICVQKQPIMIVMELVPGGSLLNFLRKNAQSLVSKQLLRMCRDAAAGMQYLESKNCIHRDLAARNCLIGDDNIVKISDFGMSREEEEYIVSDGMKQIPIKWTAPEALNFGKYTSLCDVWSYGILTWEIFSKGGTPYSGMSNTRARERIDAGYRMPAPDNTPSDMYRLMLRCWSYESESRPHFDEIHNVVDALVVRGE